MKIEIIFPIYNEEENILLLIEQLSNYLNNSKNTNITLNEIFITFVNDGSKDQSILLLTEHAPKLKKYKIIDLTRNFGHQNALAAAFSISDADAVIVMDADLQDPLVLIEQLVDKFTDDIEIVHAVRLKRKGETYFKKITAKLFYNLFQKINSFTITKNSGDCKLYSKKVINLFNSVQKQDIFFRGMSNYFGFKSDVVLYNRDERKFGKTKYPFFKMVDLASKSVLNFSDKPLIYFGNFYLGISFSLFMLIISITLFQYFNNGTIKGWTSLVAIIVILNLLNSFFLYIISLYIAKITKNSINYPNFVIQKIIK